MQKVEGSSPFSRSIKLPGNRGVFYWADGCGRELCHETLSQDRPRASEDRRVAVQRTDAVDGVSAVMPLRPSPAGSSGSFLVLADDGRRYWCKSLNNFQNTRVPATEQIVARFAELIGAPACESKLVNLTSIAGWEFRPGGGRMTEPGWAHGSLAVQSAIETRALEHRSDDENRKHHAGIFALCDWLAGGDMQWLYAASQDNAYYSHDHGFYLGGPEWTEQTLAASGTPRSSSRQRPTCSTRTSSSASPRRSSPSRKRNSRSSCRSFRMTGRSPTQNCTQPSSSRTVGVRPWPH